MKKILIADDDRTLRKIVCDVLKEEGFETVEAEDGLEALRAFKQGTPDVALLDLNMPHMNGMEVMKELKKIDAGVPIIILTGFGDIPIAVEAIKQGAYDFTTKPPEFEKLVVTINRAAEKRQLLLEMKRVSNFLEASLEQTFGKSAAIKTVMDKMSQVAKTDLSLIIQGETGTGKSFVANAIHNMSNRAGRPFVRVDMGVIPETLAESELFGYKKGAFTGASRNKAGYFESAAGGTVFIDEIENMSAAVQSKLLGVIDEKKVFPLGAVKAVDVDVRVIAATNTDIRQSVKDKHFREDLFYRLDEFIIFLPPLRDRKEDIAFFAWKFLTDAAAELNKPVGDISDDAVALLTSYSWPGNVRELKNVIRKAVLLADASVIDRRHIELLFEARPSEHAELSGLPLKDAVREMEKARILEALEKAGGNKTAAAEFLQISYTTLWTKIKEYGIA